MGGERTDSDRAVLDRHSFQFGDAADINQRRRRRQTQLQERDQAVSAGQELGAGIFSQQVAGFGNRARPEMLKKRFSYCAASPTG